MMAAAKGLADKPILITPRTLFYMFGAIIIGTITGYAWLFSTFATVATLNAHAADFQDYVVSQDVRALKIQVMDTNDKLWELEQRITAPGGATLSNKERRRDLNTRVKTAEKKISCIQSNGKHCLGSTDS